MLSMVVTYWIKITDRDDVLRKKNANHMEPWPAWWNEANEATQKKELRWVLFIKFITNLDVPY